MAMAAGMPPPLPSRAYISAPRASPHPPSLTLELPHIPRQFPCIQLSSPPPPFKLGRRRRSASPSTSPLFSLPPKLLRVVRRHSPASLSSFPSCTLRRRSPAACRPPPWTPCPGRRLNLLCKCTVSFAVVLATHRCNPGAISWSGALF
jgi:hypothetical protein